MTDLSGVKKSIQESVEYLQGLMELTRVEFRMYTTSQAVDTHLQALWGRLQDNVRCIQAFEHDELCEIQHEQETH